MVFTTCKIGKARSRALGLIIYALLYQQAQAEEFLASGARIDPNLEITILYAQMAIRAGYRLPTWLFTMLEKRNTIV